VYLLFLKIRDLLSIPGPNVNGVENVIPEGCIVEQVAYVSRHGSRYPDGGAYNEWVALYDKVSQCPS